MTWLAMLPMYLHRTAKLAERSDLYRHQVGLLRGGRLDLSTLYGRPVLIVNTASLCSFTPQYRGLQLLHERYGERGLQVLGSPSPDFASQEFDDPDQIGAFCDATYAVKFPLTEPMSVRATPDPLWADLARQPGSAPPVWNFTKYLVGADGKLIARWPTWVAPTSRRIVTAIERALGS